METNVNRNRNRFGFGSGFGVFLIYAVTMTGLPAGAWCETAPRPSTAEPNPHLAPHHFRNRGGTMHGLRYRPERDDGGRPQLGPRQADEQGADHQAYHHLGTRDGSQTKPSAGGRPERSPRTGTAPALRDKRIQNRFKPAETEWRDSPLDPEEDCVKGEIRRLVHGQLEVMDPGGGGRVPARGSPDQRVGISEESWHRLRPVVGCGDDAMTLTVRRTQAAGLQLHRENESPLPLSQLPPRCGYSVRTSVRDLSLRVRYDGCHVALEGDHYVLPLLWRRTAVRISCLASRIRPQDVGLSFLCCSSSGLTVRAQGRSAAEELRVNVRGRWRPLLGLAERCGYFLDRRPAEIAVTASFAACGVTIEDGKPTLSLRIGRETFTLSCPGPLLNDEPFQAQDPPIEVPHHGTRELREGPSGPAEPFPGAPPFYLAPPYYPHPTYRQKDPAPHVGDAYDPPEPRYLPPDPAFDPQPLPDSLNAPYLHTTYSNKHPSPHGSESATGDIKEPPVPRVPDISRAPASSFRTDGPPLQPPIHTFNPYYHYYHHPKIPIPGPPQNPDPGPDVAEQSTSTNSHIHEIPAFPICAQESDPNSNHFPLPVLWTPDTVPSSPEFPPESPEPHASYLPHPHPHRPYPPQLQPHHYFYYPPYSASAEANGVAPLHPDMAAETGLSHADVIPHDLVPFVPDHMETRHLNPALDDDTRPSAPVTPLHPDPHPAVVPLPKWPSSSSHRPPPPHPYHFHPYHLYRHGLPGVLNQPFPTFTKPLGKHPAAKSMFDVPAPVLNPYYSYYNHYHHPEATVDQENLQPADIKDSEMAASRLLSDNGETDPLAHSDKPGYPGHPQPLYDPVHSFYPYFVSWPRGLYAHPSGGKDRLEVCAPSAPPCVLGHVSDFDCGNSMGCCWYPVRACTVGRYFVVALPDCVLDPTLSRPARPSDGANVSCTLEKLPSTHGVYTLPLDGCGVSKHAFGDVVVHLLEVNGVVSRRADGPSGPENSPVRLMVECRSLPGSLGEVRLHVLDHPPPPAAQLAPAMVNVQLRIATDQSFSDYHPEAHLPLSLLRGRPLNLEVGLLDPPEPDLMVLVHSCLAYTHTPFPSWMPVYDSCSSHGDPQPSPSPHSGSHHMWRITVSSFLALPLESPSDKMRKGSPDLVDPEIYFLCLTEVCYASDAGCSISCTNSPNSEK